MAASGPALQLAVGLAAGLLSVQAMLYTLFWGSLLTELSHALRTLLRQNTPHEVKAVQRLHTALRRALPLGLALIALWVMLGVAGALAGAQLAASPSHASAYLSGGAQQRWLKLSRPPPPPEHTPLVYPPGLAVPLEVVAGVTLLRLELGLGLAR